MDSRAAGGDAPRLHADDPALLRIRQLVIEAVRRSDAADPLTLDDGLAELDSLSVVELIVLIEAEFGVEFDAADINRDSFSSIENLWTLVQRTAASQPADGQPYGQ